MPYYMSGCMERTILGDGLGCPDTLACLQVDAAQFAVRVDAVDEIADDGWAVVDSPC